MGVRTKGKGSRGSRNEWRTLLARFEGSGLDVTAFCRREAISAASFYRWRALLNGEAPGGQIVGSPATPAFLDVGTLNPASASRPRIDLKVDLGEGLILHLVRH
jgi:hypothetical protein